MDDGAVCVSACTLPAHMPEHTDTPSTKPHAHVSNENSVEDWQSSIVSLLMRFNTELYSPAATGQIALVGKLVPSQHLPFIICPWAYLSRELKLGHHRRGAKRKPSGFITDKGKSQNKRRICAPERLSLFTCLLGCKIGMQRRLIGINCITQALLTPTRSPAGFCTEFRLFEWKPGNLGSAAAASTWTQSQTSF